MNLKGKIINLKLLYEKLGKHKIDFFIYFKDWVMDWAHELKKCLVNGVGGGLGSIIKKPTPNPARCHSYSSLSRYKIRSSIVFPLTNKS